MKWTRTSLALLATVSVASAFVPADYMICDGDECVPTPLERSCFTHTEEIIVEGRPVLVTICTDESMQGGTGTP